AGLVRRRHQNESGRLQFLHRFQRRRVHLKLVKRPRGHLVATLHLGQVQDAVSLKKNTGLHARSLSTKMAEVPTGRKKRKLPPNAGLPAKFKFANVREERRTHSRHWRPPGQAPGGTWFELFLGVNGPEASDAWRVTTEMPAEGRRCAAAWRGSLGQVLR